MLESYIRPFYQRICVDHIARIISPYCTPSQVSFASLLAGLCSAVALAFNAPFSATFFLILSGYLDTLDGTVARISKRSSPYGAMTDIMCDRVVETALILAFFSLSPTNYGWPALCMLGSILLVVTSFLTAAMVLPNASDKSFNYSHNLMERPEAFLFFTAMIWMPHHFSILAYVFSLLVLYTTCARLFQLYQVAKTQRDS